MTDGWIEYIKRKACNTFTHTQTPFLEIGKGWMFVTALKWCINIKFEVRTHLTSSLTPSHRPRRWPPLETIAFYPVYREETCTPGGRSGGTLRKQRGH